MRIAGLAIAAALTMGATDFAQAEAVDGYDARSRSKVHTSYMTSYGGKRVVSYRGGQRPGTIVISTRKRTLHYVLPGGKAIQYGIGVGRQGFQWRGTMRISRKAEWPGWTPPPAMRKRQPGLPRYMPGGINNPLGARALYLGSSIYRIHGTNQPHTIGHAVSSGCIRMVNKEVIDLYNRVGPGTKVVVR